VNPLTLASPATQTSHFIGDSCAVPASDGKACQVRHMPIEAKICADATSALYREARIRTSTSSACFSPITNQTSSGCHHFIRYIFDASGNVKGTKDAP